MKIQHFLYPFALFLFCLQRVADSIRIYVHRSPYAIVSSSLTASCHRLAMGGVYPKRRESHASSGVSRIFRQRNRIQK